MSNKLIKFWIKKAILIHFHHTFFYFGLNFFNIKKIQITDQPSCATLWKQKSRANKTSDQLENQHTCDKENKQLKRSTETAEQ